MTRAVRQCHASYGSKAGVALISCKTALPTPAEMRTGPHAISLELALDKRKVEAQPHFSCVFCQRSRSDFRYIDFREIGQDLWKDLRLGYDRKVIRVIVKAMRGNEV